MESYKYIIYGLKVSSDFLIRKLPVQDFGEPEVKIRKGKVPKKLPTISTHGILYEANQNDVLFKFEKFGVSFRIQDGRLITVELKDIPFREEHEVLLLTSVIGILLHQSQLLPIHGSSINTANGAYVFIGKSSAGKSSLAAEFLSKGYQVISDDISVFNLDKDNNIELHSGLPYLKLWKDILQLYAQNKNYERVRPDIQKYIFPHENNLTFKTKKIAGVIVLSPHHSPDFKLTEVKGIERIKYLTANTYRKQFIEPLGKQKKQFLITSELAKQSNFFLLERPSSPLLITDLRKYIEIRLIQNNEF